MFKKWWVLRNTDNGVEGGGGGGVETPPAEAPTKTAEEQLSELKAQYEATIKERDTLRAHNERILGDTKGAKEAAAKAALEAKKLEEQKAREEGNWKQLLEGATAEKNDITNQYTALQQKYANEKAMAAALQIASKLIDPAFPQNAELLAESIVSRIKYDFEKGTPCILNARGEESLMTLADFSKEVDTTAKYASLLKSSQRSGGGAKGSGGGASKKNEKSNAEFTAMDVVEQRKFIKAGGSIVG